MSVQEYQFCKTKGDRITLPLPAEAMQVFISLQDVTDLLTVMKECVEGRSPAWFFAIEIKHYVRPTKVVPFERKKLSKETMELMIEGYKESADEDLIISEEFREIENEIDDECDS